MELNRRRFLQTFVAATTLPFLRQAEGKVTRVLPGHLRQSERPLNYESVRSTFTTRITPTDRFYLRNHFDLPHVDVKTWRLSVHGLVEKPLSLSLAELERMPQTTVEAVLQCAGNGRVNFIPHVPGVQWRCGAMGNAQWAGVRLKDVLARAAPKEAAAFLRLQGAERPVLATTPPFVRAIPWAKAMHEDTLIALRMNGKPLPADRGLPARLVVPGWVGDDWVRALVDLEVRVDEPTDFYYSSGYRFPVKPGAPGAAVPADQMKPMTVTNVKSLLGSVDDGDVLRPGRHELVGVAFSGEVGIDKVELSFDDGKSWAPATLDAAGSRYGFRVFRYGWEATPGSHRIACRATDAKGAVQPEVPVWNPGGYLYNAIDKVAVEVRS